MSNKKSKSQLKREAVMAESDQKKTAEQKADQLQSEQSAEYKFPQGVEKVQKLRKKAMKIVEENPAKKGEPTGYVPVVNMELTDKQYKLLFD